ncbi:MAG: hypothetical protein PWQ87_299 [Candidatus Woesearchaeota archaeon]|nr:hypothetical protein [Candidatus Woesearchaeota archaeon]
MKISEILDYIKAYLDLGYTKKQIVDILVKKGASLNEIELCFKQLGVYSVEDLASVEYLFNNLLIALIDEGWKDVTKSMTPLFKITEWNFIGYKQDKGKEWYLLLKRTGEFNENNINSIAVAFSLLLNHLSGPNTNFVFFIIADSVSYLATKRFLSMESLVNSKDPLRGTGRTYLVDMNTRKCHGKEFVNPPNAGEFVARIKHTVEAELRLDIDLFEREEYAKKRKHVLAMRRFSLILFVLMVLIALLFLFYTFFN